MQVVYAELHGMAQAQMRRQSPGHTLQATALVNEAWMKLVRLPDPQWSDRRHFFQVGARAMRSILIDHVRAKRSAKRQGGERLELFDDVLADGRLASVDVVALDEALTKLAGVNAAMAELVELRFFGGLTMEEVAECLEVSLSKAKRTWRGARAWLFLALGGESGEEDDAPVD